MLPMLDPPSFVRSLGSGWRLDNNNHVVFVVVLVVVLVICCSCSCCVVVFVADSEVYTVYIQYCEYL